MHQARTGKPGDNATRPVSLSLPWRQGQGRGQGQGQGCGLDSIVNSAQGLDYSSVLKTTLRFESFDS